MSAWTHVAAVFRVDKGWGTSFQDFSEVFGKECLWDSPSKVWDDAENNPSEYLPVGTEGSLEMSVWENPDKSCLAAYTVSIFGDLRDFDNVTEIKEWFYRCCQKLGCKTRQAVATIECENGDCSVVQFGGWHRAREEESVLVVDVSSGKKYFLPVIK